MADGITFADLRPDGGPGSAAHHSPFDDPDFVASKYVNSVYRPEDDQLDSKLRRLGQKVHVLDREIHKSVRDQSTRGASAKEDLQAAQQAVVALAEQMMDIREKARVTEDQVQDIVKEISSMDQVKKHLQHSITGLHKLKMLTRAVNGLDALRQSTSTFDSSSYQDCADNLSVSRQLLAHFDGYNRIPRVNELRHKMSEIEYHLKSAVRRDLEGLTDSDHLDVMDLELTIQACKVVDALDDLFKQEVVNQFCRGRLDPYEQLFAPYRDGGVLDKTERRYGWLLQELRTQEEEYGLILPPQWEINLHMCRKFCEATNYHMTTILGDAEETMNITALLHALTKTQEMEERLCAKFGQGGSKGAGGGGGGRRGSAGGGPVGSDTEEEDVEERRIAEAEEEESVDVDPSSAEGIKFKFRRQVRAKRRDERRAARKKEREAREEEAAAAGAGGGGKVARKSAAVSDEAKYNFQGALTGVYQPYLGQLIAMERRNMEDRIGAIIRDDSFGTQGNARERVLTSSAEVFGYFKKNLKRVGNMTQKGVGGGQGRSGEVDTLLQLVDLFRDALCNYSAHLYDSVIHFGAAGTGTEGQQMLCVLFETSAYCADTTEQLAESCTKLVNERQMAAHQAEVEVYAKREAEIQIRQEEEAAAGSGGSLINSDGLKANQSAAAGSAGGSATASAAAESARGDGSQQPLSPLAQPADPSLMEVDMGSEYDQFKQSESSALEAIITNFMQRLEPCLVTMWKTKWELYDNVGDQSKWVSDVAAVLVDVVPPVSGVLSQKHFLFFCIKFAKQFASAYMASVYKCKKIGDMGAQQLLLDTSSLRTQLLEVPTLTPDGIDPPQTKDLKSYNNYVQKEMGRAEAILKVILAPPDAIVDTYESLIPEGSQADLTQLMQLKGMRAADQKDATAVYQGRAPQEGSPKAKKSMFGFRRR